MDASIHAIADTPIHLGLGAVAVPLDGFAWSPEHMGAYAERFAADGDEGRLVTFGEMAEDWDSWERHPAGEEVVLCVSGRFRLHQDVDGDVTTVEIGAGQYVVNPPGVWHTADVLEPGACLFVTPGRGTGHRPR